MCPSNFDYNSSLGNSELPIKHDTFSFFIIQDATFSSNPKFNGSFVCV